jgi:hypothetical protein
LKRTTRLLPFSGARRSPTSPRGKTESPGLCGPGLPIRPPNSRWHGQGGRKCSLLRFSDTCRVPPSGTPVSPAGYSLASEPVHVHDQCNRHGDPIRECQGRNDSAYHTPRKRVGDGVAEFDGIANVRRRRFDFSSAGCGRGTIPCTENECRLLLHHAATESYSRRCRIQLFVTKH